MTSNKFCSNRIIKRVYLHTSFIIFQDQERMVENMIFYSPDISTKKPYKPVFLNSKLNVQQKKKGTL